MSSPAPVHDVARPRFARRHRRLFESQTWGVLLNKNQSYLGRSIVYLRQRLIEDPLDLTATEREELWDEVIPGLARALEGAFAPDRLNYSHLANRTNLVHWHVVPRYERDPVREFAGHTFEDTRLGKNFRARKQDRLPRSALKQIAREIQRHVVLAPASPSFLQDTAQGTVDRRTVEAVAKQRRGAGRPSP